MRHRRRSRERRGRRPVIAWMTRPHVLAGIGGGLLLAVFAGVGLGNAAVEGINPAHYSTPAAPRPRIAAATSSSNLSQRMPSYSELYGWEAGEMARNVACGAQCDGEEGYSARVPYFGSREELAAAERTARRAIDNAFAKADADALGPKERDRREPVRIEYETEPVFAEETIAVGNQE